MGGNNGQPWVLQCAVKDGQLDAFKALMEEMVGEQATSPAASATSGSSLTIGAR